MTDQEQTIRVIALGGYGQIGMNCTLIECEHRLLMLDCGVAFCNEPRLGADYRYPNFEFVKENADRIEALVLTHGHEDHVAAITHLPPEVHMPIFGGPCTLGLVHSRLSESGSEGRFPRQTVFPGVPFRAGPFQLTARNTPHSIIDNYSYLIEAAGRRLLFTGDYKLDRLSREGGADTLALISAMRPLDLMIGDSTGVFEAEDAGDELAIGEVATQLMTETPGRVYVAMFSSNVARLAHLTRAAIKAGRRVTFAGRSMENHIAVAVAAGRAPSPSEHVVPLDDLNALVRDRSLVFVSGSQGESQSVLNRLAEGTHRTLNIQDGDAVLLSSRTIPGNELAVARIVDQLLLRGAKVYNRHTHPSIHVSGHGSVDEIRAAIETARPRVYIPAHGTVAHLYAASQLAAEVGIEHVGVILNGDTATLTDRGLELTRSAVPSDPVTVENGRVVGAAVLREREVLGNRGFIQIEIVWDAAQEKDRVQCRFTSRGAFSEEEMIEVSADLRRKIAELIDRLTPEDLKNLEGATDRLRNPLRRHLQKTWRTDPYLIISVVRKRFEEESCDEISGTRG